MDELEKQYHQIKEEISQAQERQEWVKLGELLKRKEYLEEILNLQHEIKQVQKKLKEAEEILKQEKEEDLQKLALQEKRLLEKKLAQLQKTFHNLLKPKEKTESIILEIRPGVGGQEAALFAKDLFSMYLKYAQKKGWKIKILEIKKTDLDGLKEVIFEITGKGVYSKLKYEGGIHRVQRIPETEKSGRIHTSTASVVVLQKPKTREIQINPGDLKIETFRASGPGGQYVNRRESAVRITHLPTGIVVSCQSERTQAQNKENALAILRARLLYLQQEKEKENIQKLRKSQIGKMERSEKIRTYNFPQDRITDHRIKKTWHNLEEILSGKLDPLIEELEKSKFNFN